MFERLPIPSISFQSPIRLVYDCVLDSGRIDASVRNNRSRAPNTRRSYAGALDRLKRWLDGRFLRLSDASLSRYIEHLERNGYAPESAKMVVNAVRFYAKVQGCRCPAGPLTDAALTHLLCTARGRGRGQAEPLLEEEATAILATAGHRRGYADGRFESLARAARRAVVDRALVAVLFLGALRRSEAAALTWNDVEMAADGEGVRLHVRCSKTDREGAEADVRYVNGEFATAIMCLRDADDGTENPGRPVFGGLTGASLSRRLGRAAEAAGIGKRITAHSGRVGLAVELTLRGASTHDVMHAGNWKSAAMVARYTAGARAERGPVARHMARKSRLGRADDHPLIVAPDMLLNAPATPGAPAAAGLGVTRQALSELVNGRTAVSVKTAIRLSQAFGSTPETWLGMQMAYDLWRARERAAQIKVERFAVA